MNHSDSATGPESSQVLSSYHFALYDAFSEVAFGGSQAAVITNTASIAPAQRQRIAREIGMPATAFVDANGPDWIEAQFISTVMELPMCGHGTLCLMTHMLETGALRSPHKPYQVELRLPKSVATVSLSTTVAGRAQVMLDIRIPDFEAPPPDAVELLQLLGLAITDLAQDLPIETARGEFVHLVVPLGGLDAMRSIEADFAPIVTFCRRHGLETIVVFCTEVEQPGNHVHVRDFCPAVGVSESAAAGTSNAALTSYLIRHAVVSSNKETVIVRAEQGIELGRPSSIQSIATLADNRICRLQVGGVATRVLDGNLYLQASDERDQT